MNVAKEQAVMNINMGLMNVLYKLSKQLMKVDDLSPDPSVLAEFRARYVDINYIREKFQDAYSGFMVRCQDLTVRTEVDNSLCKFHDMFYSIQVLYETLCLPSTETKPVTYDRFHQTTHLQPINLNRFSGNYTDWPSFISLFNSLVHNKLDIGCVQKMHYLISVLDKEPFNLVRHLELSDTNYVVAYNLLRDRYENKRLIADKHLDVLLSLSSLNPNQLHVGLRKFVNTINENTQALTALGFDLKSWSFILLHIFLRKLPLELRSRFESGCNESSNTLPTFEQLTKFLESQLRVLESVAGVKGSTSSSGSSNTHTNPPKSYTVSTSACLCCNGDHNLYICDKFNSMSPTERVTFVKQNKLCFNCLRSHAVSKCLSKSRCQICRRQHHTKLHLENQLNASNAITDEDFDSKSKSVSEAAVSTLSSTVQPLHSHGVHDGSTMLLGTALVGIQDINGHIHTGRALLDCGSQVSIIAENFAQKLRLPRSTSGSLYGIGGSDAQRTSGTIECSIRSLLDSSQPALVTKAVVLKRITGTLPNVVVAPKVIEKCKDLSLADNKCSTPGPIDLLIGIDLYDQIFDGRKLPLGDGLPTAYASIFGWVLMGKAPMASSSSHPVVSLSCTVDLDSILTKFWEVEQVPSVVIQDPENLQCEKHFVETHTRDETGRFIVRLPFKASNKSLGETHGCALKRFHNLECKLIKNPQLREMYIAFMADYLETGHMRPIDYTLSKDRYYIPHHGVIKESSSSTKLRAVFDASAASSSGVSLNQVLMPGPKLQQNIVDIILRFRTHTVVFTCDIKQMYRQIRLMCEDCRFQTIFWRESPDKPLQLFELTTVTYGVSSAAYLAIRVIHELAHLNKATHPEASRVLLEDTFVDDVISGSHDVESAKVLQKQIVEVLAQGCFHLRKWSSNCSELLNEFPADHHETPFRFEESGDNIFKILGVEWNSKLDSFIYCVSNFGKCNTKRDILSNIARIYDPCGYLAPVTFLAKVMMQRLWTYEGLTWDDPLPQEFSKLWNSFAEGFGSLKLAQIPRFILTEQPLCCELMGFSDASENGYSAVVYLRVQDANGEVKVHLLLAKSRVAPIKLKLTIPRLELSGTVLLAQLLSHVKEILENKITINKTIAWCDSSIALAWLRTPPHKLQTFEGNRVSQVHGLVPSVQWRHVPSALNPADCASRGALPADLVDFQLWWSPPWLKEDPSTWPADCQLIAGDLPGLKQLKTSTLTATGTDTSTEQNEKSSSIINRFNSLTTLQRVLAWGLRFVHNSRNPNDKIRGNLTVKELDNALHRAVKLTQHESFTDHIQCLQKQKNLKGPIARLNPFLDSNGLLRVGGRLKNSDLPFDAKHPLLLPKKHKVVDMLIDHYHLKHLHVGPTSLINILHQRFWILSARRVVRYRVHRCHRCHRLKAKTLEPFMGNLPSPRVRQARPYSRVGIDFAGPFTVKFSTMRYAKTQKAYLCVFVCLAVKAVHLEVTSDLTTDAFMACFSRFVSRRGLSAEVYTDCGTNFQGAKRHLKEVDTFLVKNKDNITKKFVDQGVTWHMNPPYAPHMGGIWEATVKSAKQLLKRTIGDQTLTFEELGTIFAKVESILNSRPLCPMSDDPSDLGTLTPGHFLIGQPLVGLPEYNFEHTPISRLSRWQLIQQITQHFWRRWQHEYLHNLQQRTKWCKDTPNLQLGDLVLIKEDNIPPLKWRKGRVLRLHPGTDGVVRVAELKISSGSCLRPVTKLCPLPFQRSSCEN